MHTLIIGLLLGSFTGFYTYAMEQSIETTLVPEISQKIHGTTVLTRLPVDEYEKKYKRKKDLHTVSECLGQILSNQAPSLDALFRHKDWVVVYRVLADIVLLTSAQPNNQSLDTLCKQLAAYCAQRIVCCGDVADIKKWCSNANANRVLQPLVAEIGSGAQQNLVYTHRFLGYHKGLLDIQDDCVIFTAVDNTIGAWSTRDELRVPVPQEYSAESQRSSVASNETIVRCDDLLRPIGKQKVSVFCKTTGKRIAFSAFRVQDVALSPCNTWALVTHVPKENEPACKSIYALNQCKQRLQRFNGKETMADAFFSSRDTFVCMVDHDHIPHVWHTTKKYCVPLLLTADDVYVRFSPDERLLVTQSRTTGLYSLWDIATGKRLCFEGIGEIHQILFDTRSNSIVSQKNGDYCMAWFFKKLL